MAEYLNTALAIITIATLAGLGLLRGTVVSLREQLNDERQLNKVLKEKRAEDAVRITALEVDMSALQRVVTGEVHWVTLTNTLNDHHTQAMDHWRKFDDVLEAILEELKGMPHERH